MSENPYTNMDARDLHELAQRLRTGDPLFAIRDEDIAMLLRSAQHLQSMDEKLSRHIDGDFSSGVTFAERAAKARSNILPPVGRRVTNAEGETLIAAFAQTGKVKRLPTGATTPAKPQLVEVDPGKSAPARTGFRLGDL